MAKTQVEIELLLPGVQSHDKCIERLLELVESKHGIGNVHVKELDGNDTGRVCIHFDPKLISMGEARRLAIQAGAQLSSRYGHLLLKTKSMDVRQARRVGDQLRKANGVLDAGVSAAGVIRVEFAKEMTDEALVREAIEQLGITVKAVLTPKLSSFDHGHAGHDPSHEDSKSQPAIDDHAGHDHAGHDHAGHDHAGHDHGKSAGGHDHSHGGIFGERSELIFAIICGVLLLIKVWVAVRLKISFWP